LKRCKDTDEAIIAALVAVLTRQLFPRLSMPDAKISHAFDLISLIARFLVGPCIWQLVGRVLFAKHTDFNRLLGIISFRWRFDVFQSCPRWIGACWDIAAVGFKSELDEGPTCAA